MSLIHQISHQLYAIEALKFGSFTLKSGIISPIYLDLRKLIGSPALIRSIAQALLQQLNKENITYDTLCGVPYGALALATAMSLSNDKPLIIRRKEAKAHGTKQSLEGVLRTGDRCVVVEDLITTGTSILETAKDLREAGIVVTDAIVIVDREQGGAQNLQQAGIRLHALCTLPHILEILESEKKISSPQVDAITTFLKDSSTRTVFTATTAEPTKLSYQARSDIAVNPISRGLFSLMESKQTNLAVAADVTRGADLLRLADAVGPSICLLKTHIDILEDFEQGILEELLVLADRHQFFLFEDRKFADIGNTVQLQYQKGIYRIADWAHLTNAHILPGPGIIDGLYAGTQQRPRGLLLIAQMSSQGALINEEYISQAVAWAEKRPDFIVGFICQKRITDDPKFVHMTPGVHLGTQGDSLGQQYQTPAKVIGTEGNDIQIVGRGIVQAADPAAEAERYREAGWLAYLDRCGHTQTT